jgi:hypothetical protein
MKRLLPMILLACAIVAQAASAPTITGMSMPPQVVPGAQISMQGTGFTGATKVTIGTVTDATFTVIDDSDMTFLIPLDGPPGGVVSVTTPAGIGAYAAFPLVVTKLTPPAGPVCLPNTGNTNTIFNPSTGNTIVGLWCDIAAGTYHYAVGGSATAANFTQASCLAGVPPFTVSLAWVQAAWSACVNQLLSPSDQAYANRLAYFYVPRPTILGTGPQSVFTTAKNGGLGSPLILGTPQAFQTIAAGTSVGGLRIPGGNVTRYCDVSGYTSIQGNLIPPGSYAPCNLVFPPAGGFVYPTSADKAEIMAPTENILVDAAHHVWGIDAKGIITVDGVEDPTTGGVIELAFVGGLVWQENTAKLWWSKTAPTAAWLPAAGTATAPL